MAERTAIDTALAMIRQHVAMRTPQLAEKLGSSEAAVDAMLEPARTRGELITCQVEAGGRRVVEYRCSVNGGRYTIHGGFVPLRDPSRAQAPRLDLVEQTNAGTAASNTGHADQAPPRPLSPLQHHQEADVKTTMEQVKAARFQFEKLGPMKARTLAQLVAFDVTPVLKEGEKLGEFKRLSGKTSGTLWGLPGDKRPAADARERGAANGRKKAKTKAKKPAKRAGSKAAKKAWRTRRANGDKARAAPRHNPFEAALTSTGQLIFLNAKRGSLELTKDELRGFVKALRHLNEDEMCTVLDFITRLDGAEVGA